MALMAKRIRITKKTSLPVLIIVLIISLAQHFGWLNEAQQSVPDVKGAVVENQPGLYRVTKFHDGDTITIDMNGKEETVRFIGIDTPETHDPRKAVQCFGEVAAAYTKSLIGNNSVRLEADPLNTNRDRYDRLLRYVYLPDGKLVNAEIIKEGYGFAYPNFPFTKSEEFKQYQTNAQNGKKGLWGTCQPTQNKYGGYTSNDAR
jgi:endonuclease YncB( thermonuclease family)